MARSRIRAAPPRHSAMRTRSHILMLAALGLSSGLTPAFGFEGTARPSVEVITPATAAPMPPGMAPASASSRAADVPRPPGSIPRTIGVTPAVATVPGAGLPRPTAPVPSLATPATPSLQGPVPPPTAFAAPATPITPFEAFRSAARALKDGDKGKALVSLEYAAEQGLIEAPWK